MQKISENISARTLFHFTTKFEYLLQILEFDFKPRYCLEDTSWASTESYKNIEMAYPMVCFCDIPLSKIKKHLTKYGYYGIGLTKKWGFSKSLTPMIYSRKNSKTSKIVDDLIKYYGENGEPNSLKYTISDLLMYIKPYYGKMWRNTKYKKTRFYDEREWRWIPDILKSDLRMHLESQEYFNQSLRQSENTRIGDNYTLDYKPEDIRYLILKDDDEIDALIEHIEKLNDKYDSISIKKLTSRILTSDQIKYDF